ncbi:glycosyltransferase family 2 protein [Phyllobacterium zundukense]|uniref:Cellulose synthase n=1 Tax=Phyllobacterium zundukense TaxID=1867719 RepID=A0A2N9VXT7_9HYPH|nr:cellulose synthase catalytic subunit [Phyllobacterium zundukense]ATU95691.1 cellulose synthase [Phyllobacterium zundukense]PIO44305.1 cellulose synthase [Phyllobacterium zundukense]
MFFDVNDDVASVLVFDVGVALTFIVFSRIADRERLADRILFGSAAILSLVLYISWRWLDTLPDLEITGSSLWAYFYFTFETVSVVYGLGSIFILFRMSDWTREADDAQEELKALGTYPSVDVFICTYNEPINILEKSVISARSMDYPRFKIYVCDDTRRPQIKDYCARVGVNYITRPDNGHAKAGNLNNALALTNSAGNSSDLIMVLDADFAPQENFLMRVTGLFRNGEIGLVQTPQFYFNSDPIQHNLGISSSFVDDQRVFFDTFQPAKDAAGCAFCVGTSFVVRRSLLNEMGGFPHEALSEDMLLTYRLMERGYVTRWLNEKLSVGLSAEGIPEYITQRTRWCLGTIQIGLLKDGPLWRGRFTLTQRLHYIHGLLSWLSKPFILCMLFAPSIYWLFDVSAIQADELVFMKYGISALFVFWSYSSWISGRRTLPLFTEVTHAITALPVTITLCQAIRKPFGRPFKVTEKGGDRSTIRIHAPTAIFFGLVTLLSAFSVVTTVFAWSSPTEFSERDCMNLVWSAFSMLIAFVSLLVCIELPRFGQEELIKVHMRSSHRAKGTIREIRIDALSTQNALIEGLNLSGAEDEAVFISGVGWVRIESEMSMPPNWFRIVPNFQQHNDILHTLFRKAPDNVAKTGMLGKSMIGLCRRALFG